MSWRLQVAWQEFHDAEFETFEEAHAAAVALIEAHPQGSGQVFGSDGLVAISATYYVPVPQHVPEVSSNST